MPDKSIPSPADKLLAMLEEDPDNIEQLPLDVIMARLREHGVDPTMPARFRELVDAGFTLPAADETAGEVEPVYLRPPRVPPAVNPPAVKRSTAVVRPEITANVGWLSRTHFHRRLLLTLVASWAVVGFQVALLVLLKEPMARSVGFGTTSLDAVLSFSLLGTAFGAVAFGWLVDKLSRRFVFIASLALYILGVILTPLSGSVWVLVLFYLVAGISIGGEYVAINATIQKLKPAQMRSQARLAVHPCFWFGSAAGALGSLVLLFAALAALQGHYDSLAALQGHHGSDVSVNDPLSGFLETYKKYRDFWLK